MRVGRRVEPHRLRHDHLRVRAAAAGRRRSGAGRRAPRRSSSARRASASGMLGEQVPGPRQRHRGRLVAGQEERHDLVAHLPVGHAAAVVGVLRLQQHREQVAAVLAAGAPRGDDAVDDRVELAGPPAASAGCAASAPSRGASGRLASARRSPPSARAGASATSSRSPPNLGVEERLGDDGLGERHHLGVDVADLAVRPAAEPARGVGGHHLAVGGDALAVERGLHEPALAQPRVALAAAAGRRRAAARSSCSRGS